MASRITHDQLRELGYFSAHLSSTFMESSRWWVCFSHPSGQIVRVIPFKNLDWSDVMDELAVDFTTRRLKGWL